MGSGTEVSGKMDTLGNLVLDGVFTVLSEVDQGSRGIGSCTVASVGAAHVPQGCSSVVVRVRIWAFRVSGSAKCVTQRGVGLLGSDATGVMLHVILFPTVPPWVRWRDRFLNRVSLILQLGAQGLVIPPRNKW